MAQDFTGRTGGRQGFVRGQLGQTLASLFTEGRTAAGRGNAENGPGEGKKRVFAFFYFFCLTTINYDFQAFLSKNRVYGVENRLSAPAPDRPGSRPEVRKFSKNAGLSLRRRPCMQSYTKVGKVNIFLHFFA
jgi:hypothetical protein